MPKIYFVKYKLLGVQKDQGLCEFVKKDQDMKINLQKIGTVLEKTPILPLKPNLLKIYFFKKRF